MPCYLMVIGFKYFSLSKKEINTLLNRKIVEFSEFSTYFAFGRKILLNNFHFKT